MKAFQSVLFDIFYSVVLWNSCISLLKVEHRVNWRCELRKRSCEYHQKCVIRDIFYWSFPFDLSAATNQEISLALVVWRRCVVEFDHRWKCPLDSFYFRTTSWWSNNLSDNYRKKTNTDRQTNRQTQRKLNSTEKNPSIFRWNFVFIIWLD